MRSLDFFRSIPLFQSQRETEKEKKNQCLVDSGAKVVSTDSLGIILNSGDLKNSVQAGNLASLVATRIHDVHAWCMHGYGCVPFTGTGTSTTHCTSTKLVLFYTCTILYSDQ